MIISEIQVADSPDAWRALGFDVQGDRCHVGTVEIRLGGEGTGITGWTVIDRDAAPSASPHPNGVTKIDHLVLMSADLERTTAQLHAAYAVEPKRDRDAGAFIQRFFRLGEVVLEVIGAPAPKPGEDSFWGITFRVADMNALAAHMGNRIGRVKDAVQPGRQITTLRGAEIGIGPAIAFISPPASAASVAP